MWKLITILFIFSYFNDNAYSFSIPTSGGAINLSDYQGKYILIVNTATNSQFVDQYAKLETLYQRFKDSLVIIAVPSNDFGNETNDDSTIQNFVLNTYNIHYLISFKTTVSGNNIAPLFNWLTSISENNRMNCPVVNDFQKYLIGKDGNLIGIFNSAVDPLSDQMQNTFLPEDQRKYVIEQ